MSGINEIKKKAKLSIDEMYDSQVVGKLDNQEENKPEIKQISQPEKNKINKKDVQLNNNPTIQETNHPLKHKDVQPTPHPSEKMETNLDHKQEFRPIRQTLLFPTSKQQIQKIQTYKMTFNLTEDIY